MDNVAAVACGDFNTIAVRTDGSVWTWGVGHLGNGTTSGSATPVQLSQLVLAPAPLPGQDSPQQTEEAAEPEADGENARDSEEIRNREDAPDRSGREVGTLDALVIVGVVIATLLAVLIVLLLILLLRPKTRPEDK